MSRLRLGTARALSKGSGLTVKWGVNINWRFLKCKKTYVFKLKPDSPKNVSWYMQKNQKYCISIKAFSV